MAKRKKKDEQDQEIAEVPQFNPYAHIDKEIDGMEKKFRLSSLAFDKDEPRFSTGLLSLDVALAGGMLGGGWYTCFGGEQSCKSTTAMTILSSIMAQKDFIGKASYFDYEGSSQADYIENIMGAMGVNTDVEKVFGVRDEETGDWVVAPRVRYYAPDTGEKFFNYMAKLGKMLPDKVRMNGQWYFVYDNTRENQKALKGLYDKKYFAKTNRFRVPAPDGSIQAIVLTDSYPAMLPGIADEKEEGDKSLALQARMFSDGLKRVKGMMRTKRIVVLGVNQLRKVPMAMYGPTETEPCGDALKFYSDVRLRMSSVSIPHGKGMLEEEESVVADGNDTYRYIKMRTHKNKLGGIPNQSITMRLVVENAEGDATGFCRTWDAFQYLKLTGQVGGTRKKIKFLEGFNVVKKDKKKGKEKEVYVDFKSPLAGCTLDWFQFKTLIEGEREDIRELCRELGLKKPVLFRNFLQKQVREGKAYQYMVDAKRAVNSSKRKKAAEAVSDDDDDE
tara:strand:+ start:628 stop:2133 length:1506 start_codon:yes stop_codon:yes gene_type:complete